MGYWLTRDQAKELLRVPDRSTLKGSEITPRSRCWSAARSADVSWQRSISPMCSKEKVDGLLPIFAEKVIASGQLRSRSG